MDKNTYLIELAGRRYQVRVVNGERQVLLHDEWISHSEFVDVLINNGEWPQVVQLAALGHKIVSERDGGKQ